MTFTTKNLKDSQVELTVDLGIEDLVLYTAEAEKELYKNLKLEGFRSGKVPKEVARKAVGEQVIKEEALNLAIKTSLTKILDEQKFEVVEQSDFQIKENSATRLLFSLKLVTFPEIELSTYKGLSIKKNPINITSVEIEKTIEEIVKSRTTLQEVVRSAKLGDKVELDFEIKNKGILIDGGRSQNHPVVLGENKFVPGFEAQIVGLKPGDKKSFSLIVPVDYYQKSIAGKEIDFQVELKKIYQMIVPILDDEFARSLGRFTSRADLEKNIKDGLIFEKEAKEKERIRIAILKEIADKTEVKIPAALVDKKVDAMIRGFDEELHQKGMELGLYLAHMKKTQDDLRRDWHDRAKEQVKFELIVRMIAKEENLIVNDEEIEGELQVVLQQYMAGNSSEGTPGSPAEILKNIDPEQLRNRISSVLLSEKVFDFLEKQTKFS
ncbi:MAG: trigger factor [Patescibacteria group bacterium]